MPDTEAAGVQWEPQSSLTMKSSLVETHRDQATGVLRETHWRLDVRTQEKRGLSTCYYYHEATTTQRTWYSRDLAIAEARVKGWKKRQ